MNKEEYLLKVRESIKDDSESYDLLLREMEITEQINYDIESKKTMLNMVYKKFYKPISKIVNLHITND